MPVYAARLGSVILVHTYTGQLVFRTRPVVALGGVVLSGSILAWIAIGIDAQRANNDGEAMPTADELETSAVARFHYSGCRLGGKESICCTSNLYRAWREH